MEGSVAAFALQHCAQYPLLRPQDLLKALHQSVFGCGHLIEDPSAAEAFIRQEAATCTAPAGTLIEPLDGEYCRVHLAYLRESGLCAETLGRLFALSAGETVGSTEELEEKLSALQALVDAGDLPFSALEWKEAVEEWRSAGFCARRHSPEFRDAYAPAYRVLHRRHALWLPLLAAIDRKMAQQARVSVAIEGGSASGKTTLSGLLEKLYSCQLFHMDDFFLRPEQRTPERYAAPGENIDWERFLEEVLIPLRAGNTVAYRVFDCSTFTVRPPVEKEPMALNIIEGAYSMHPKLAEYYDLSVFLKVSPQLQADRLRIRNTPEDQQRFFNQWIPLEHAYFNAMDPASRCDLIVEVEGCRSL